jgi:DNA primase
MLRAAGYSEPEIAHSNALADSRWPGRLCGAWRDERGQARTLWARTLEDVAAAGSRYLYLRGASRAGLPPYGLSQLLEQPRSARRELVLVEGLFDVHQLRSHGIENVAAIGGTATRPETFERLARLGFERVTLCLDADTPGQRATAKAVEHAARAANSPAVSVIDPHDLAPANDPDELIRGSGAGAWYGLLAKRTCGIAWRARELAGRADPSWPADDRRAALARAGAWLGTLPARLALEQEDAIQVIAERCGYSSEAVARSFRARFWREAPLAKPARSVTTIEQARGL